MRTKLLVLAVGIAIALVFWLSGENSEETVQSAAPAPGAIVGITLPDTLSTNAKIGKTAFEAKCSACHGADAVGQEGLAPPLIHKIYESSHHGDESFQRAVALGVRQHHWPFGNMPPVEGLTRGDVAMIVAYIRELQQANGIN